jgi:hypothetical protein
MAQLPMALMISQFYYLSGKKGIFNLSTIAKERTGLSSVEDG